MDRAGTLSEKNNKQFLYLRGNRNLENNLYLPETSFRYLPRKKFS